MSAANTRSRRRKNSENLENGVDIRKQSAETCVLKSGSDSGVESSHLEADQQEEESGMSSGTRQPKRIRQAPRNVKEKDSKEKKLVIQKRAAPSSETPSVQQFREPAKKNKKKSSCEETKVEVGSGKKKTHIKNEKELLEKKESKRLRSKSSSRESSEGEAKIGRPKNEEKQQTSKRKSRRVDSRISEEVDNDFEKDSIDPERISQEKTPGEEKEKEKMTNTARHESFKEILNRNRRTGPSKFVMTSADSRDSGVSKNKRILNTDQKEKKKPEEAKSFSSKKPSTKSNVSKTKTKSKKRTFSSSDESDETVIPTKKSKPIKKVKNEKSQKKTFTKLRRVPKVKNKEEKFGYSRFELRLLQMAKQMDNSDDSDEDSQESAITDSGTQEKTDSPPQKPEEAAAKKSLIMSMLKEHEDVDEMSDDSSDDEGLKEVKVENPVETKPRDNPKEKKESDVKNSSIKRKSEQKSEKKKGKKGKALKNVAEDDSSDSDDDGGWEVVEGGRDPNYKRPENVTVVLQNEDFLPEAKRLSMEQRMVRLINQKRKSAYLLCHRVHLLSLMGHHRILNSILNSDYVKAYALSLLPPSIAIDGKRETDMQIIQQILVYFKSTFTLHVADEIFNPRLLKAKLLKLLREKNTSCPTVYLFGLLAILRGAGIRSRLCLSYHLLPQKAPLLRVKDGHIVELGSKTSKLSEVDPGIADVFIEVYLSEKKRWRPLDIDDFTIIEDPHELTPHLEQPVACLIGIDNDNCMIDLSPKYNPDWLNKVKTLRCDSEFFEKALAPFAPAEKEQAEEQKEAANIHKQHGLPKIISEFKNHPKYALSRHLLKFEAFYPREPPILGYVRNEPVYPREAVHTLRSMDTWHRQARQVKEGEVPYSVVKARPKWNKRTESFMRDLPLEVYGEWQTEPYKPPVAENGVIPRNKFGNVELFHPDMLPIGTVHLKLPGLQKIADELEVDCVPAVVGFDGVGKGCHPVIEGFVVCVENQGILEDAFNERQREDRHKRRERIRKRALKNWRKLIRKVIWELRLARKYKSKLEQESLLKSQVGK